MRFSPTASRHTETRFTLWFASISTALWMATAVSAATSHFEYISPVPGSSMVSPGNNVVIREGHHIDRNSLHEDSSVLVVGSVSGPHPGRLLLADVSLGVSALALGLTAYLYFSHASDTRTTALPSWPIRF